jgi:hypothetical protein
MQNPSTPVARFFETYAHLSSSDNIPAIVTQFADTFLAASPTGVSPVRASDFAVALPKRKQLFESLGCRSTAFVSLHETPLDARFTLARTEWRLTFARPSGNEDLLVDSTFLVDTGTEPFCIALYLAHQDIMAVLKDKGILPA